MGDEGKQMEDVGSFHKPLPYGTIRCLPGTHHVPCTFCPPLLVQAGKGQRCWEPYLVTWHLWNLFILLGRESFTLSPICGLFLRFWRQAREAEIGVGSLLYHPCPESRFRRQIILSLASDK